MKIRRSKLYAHFIILSIYIFMFQYLIGQVFEPINSYDEIFSIFMLVIFLITYFQKCNKQDIYFLGSFIVIGFLGILSNIYSNIISSPVLILVDYLSIIKVYVVYYSIKRTVNDDTINRIVKSCTTAFCIYICIAFICYFPAEIFNLSYFIKDESLMRYGIKAYSFIAANAGNFGYLMMGMYALLSQVNTNSKVLKYIKFITLFLILSTTKGPQIIFVSICIIFRLIKTEKIKLYHILSVIILGSLLGRYQIVNYLLNSESARFLLIKVAIKISNYYFPLGAGFATFGSEMSRRYYSPLYYQYGINSIHGLSPNYSAYITDNYWPMLLGQIGILGTIIIAWLLYYIFKDINRIQCIEKKQKFSIMAVYITFLIGSLGSAYFNTATGMFCFIIIALVVKKNNCTRQGNANDKK